MISEPKDDQPHGQDRHGKLHPRNLRHHKDDARKEYKANVVDPRIKRRAKFNRRAFTQHFCPEFQMCDDDGRPADDGSARRDRDEIEEGVARKEVVEEHDDERDTGRNEDAEHGDAAP